MNGKRNGWKAEIPRRIWIDETGTLTSRHGSIICGVQGWNAWSENNMAHVAPIKCSARCSCFIPSIEEDEEGNRGEFIYCQRNDSHDQDYVIFLGALVSGPENSEDLDDEGQPEDNQ